MEYRILVLQHSKCTNIKEFATKMDLFITNKHINQLTLSYVGEPKDNPLAYMYACNNKSVKLISDKGNPNNKNDIDFMFELCKKAGRRKDVTFEVIICNNNGEEYALTNDICNMCIANDITFSTFDIVSDPTEVVELKPLPQKQSKSSQNTAKNTKTPVEISPLITVARSPTALMPLCRQSSPTSPLTTRPPSSWKAPWPSSWWVPLSIPPRSTPSSAWTAPPCWAPAWLTS